MVTGYLSQTPGIDPTTTFHDSLGRPISIGSDGIVIIPELC